MDGMKMNAEALKRCLMERLRKEVEERWNDGYSIFEESSPATGQVVAENVAQWLWVKARIAYEGATWGPATDRVLGDPESVHAWRDWIGLAESAPFAASTPEDLDKWALLSMTYSRTYRDIQVPGPWGIHSGRWVEELSEDGVVKVRVVTSERFRDVSPESMSTIEYVHLRK
jgi:hypothetical protein